MSQLDAALPQAGCCLCACPLQHSKQGFCGSLHRPIAAPQHLKHQLRRRTILQMVGTGDSEWLPAVRHQE